MPEMTAARRGSGPSIAHTRERRFYDRQTLPACLVCRKPIDPAAGRGHPTCEPGFLGDLAASGGRHG